MPADIRSTTGEIIITDEPMKVKFEDTRLHFEVPSLERVKRALVVSGEANLSELTEESGLEMLGVKLGDGMWTAGLQIVNHDAVSYFLRFSAPAAPIVHIVVPYTNVRAAEAIESAMAHIGVTVPSIDQLRVVA